MVKPFLRVEAEDTAHHTSGVTPSSSETGKKCDGSGSGSDARRRLVFDTSVVAIFVCSASLAAFAGQGNDSFSSALHEVGGDSMEHPSAARRLKEIQWRNATRVVTELRHEVEVSVRSAIAAERRAPRQSESPVGRGRSLEEGDAAKCDDRSRWDQMPWDYLSGAERQAWDMLGWNESAWNLAHPTIPTPPWEPPERRLLVGRTSFDSSTASISVKSMASRIATLASAQVADFSNVGTVVANGDSVRRLQSAPPPLDTGVRPPADYACYQDQLQERKDAILLLGYTIDTWHACKNPLCPWPRNLPRPDGPCLERMLYLDRMYNTTSWEDLSYWQRRMFTLLGWDEGGLRWRTFDKPPVYSRPWTELLMLENEAAVFLGFTEDVWHRCQSKTSCIKRLQVMELRFQSYKWETMPTGIRGRLEELGWSERMWLEMEEPATMKLSWADLPYTQRQAALLLGYREDTWARCPQSPCLERFAYVQNKYNGVRWQNLKLAQQRAWMLLEFGPESWGKSLPKTMQNRWEELTMAQRQQATFLGHSMGTWQGCNQNWQAIDGAANNETSAGTMDPNRIVRGRMTIALPFTNIAGNVYGQEVATLPTSFIEIFERSVARALFCGNPPWSSSPDTYIDVDGTPLCIVFKSYEMQRRRIRVLTVVEGSIIVDFYILANQTAEQATAPVLFEALAVLLDSPTSPLTMDMEFGRFAQQATVREVPFSNLEYDQLQRVLELEELRGQYGPRNGCQLNVDFRKQPTNCPSTTSAARRPISPALATMPWLLMLIVRRMLPDSSARVSF
eukprot:TRINITY_DN5330_c0_g1_i2.p1 TRINITY_DN5330_c0_g1~~TRINITY_DN5330_c0_g1_i2.p1  ORF type:complete len:792 (-),score=117.33 TRINITY_DN5330_c0_g1_i2:78-2453(-)